MKFDDILGHYDIKLRLRQMVEENRLPHALLMHGQPGIGKFMMARALAQYIHCTDRHNGDSCGKCPACIQQQTYNHIDTIFSYPILKGKNKGCISEDYITDWREFLSESPYMDFGHWLAKLGNPNGQPTMYVEESSALIHKLNFTSHASKFKTVLMWLPERMNVECANKLLKVIEEPFEDTLFILVSNNPAEVLPTIFSRTQRIELKRLPDNIVAQSIQESNGLDHADAMAIAHLSSGSILEAEQQAKLTQEQGESLELFMRLMREAYRRDIKSLRQWSNDVASLGREKEIKFLDYSQRMIRENFIYNLQNPQLNYLNQKETDFSTRFARFINERNVEQLINELNSAKTDIAGNANAKIVLLDLAVRIIILIKS